MKITLVISSLTVGGAEKVLSAMANYWAVLGKEVTVITLDAEDSDFFKLHPGVDRVSLDVAGISHNFLDALFHNLTRLWKLRKTFRESNADVLISFMNTTNVKTLISATGLGIPVVVAERNDPRFESLGWPWRWLRRMIYPFADAVVVQTENVYAWASGFIDKSKVFIIQNPVDTPDRTHPSVKLANGGDRKITALGRFVPAKGFDLLLRAFAHCSHGISGWRLEILGEGVERKKLERLALELNISDRLDMPGMVSSPITFLEQSELFVLSSRLEGFPNSLLEAMACGLPVISFDCPSGPSEIIQDGYNGLLVENGNICALSEAIERLAGDEEERARIGAAAASSSQRFSMERIMEHWEELIQNSISKSGSR